MSFRFLASEASKEDHSKCLAGCTFPASDMYINPYSSLQPSFGDGLSRKPFISSGGILVTSNCGFLGTKALCLPHWLSWAKPPVFFGAKECFKPPNQFWAANFYRFLSISTTISTISTVSISHLLLIWFSSSCWNLSFPTPRLRQPREGKPAAGDPPD